MTAKEYLSQAYLLDAQINSKMEMLDSLNGLAVKSTQTVSGMPHSPNRGGSSLGDTIAKIMDLQEEINRDIDRLVDLKREITAVIREVSDAECRVVLEQRYIVGKPWPEIAEDLGYKLRHLYKVHGHALEIVRIPASAHETDRQEDART